MQRLYILLTILLSCIITEILSLAVPASQLTLHGSQQTRSPLVNWFLIEKDIPFTQKPPRPSLHPFGQTPFLTDIGSDGIPVEVFESGAILLYLADKHGGAVGKSTSSSASDRAKFTKWVVWANAELDGLCFGKGMSGTTLDKPSRALDTLESIIGTSDWLVDNSFSVADVAVASYLNYVPVFFSSAKPTMRPNIVKYMKRAAERKAFSDSFGSDHAKLVLQKTQSWLDAGGKKFGIF